MCFLEVFVRFCSIFMKKMRFYLFVKSKATVLFPSIYNKN